MIPVQAYIAELEYKEQPSKTFKMRNDKEVVKGTCDGIEAMKQAIYLALNVERYTCPLVSWSYGVELADLFGMPTSYCIPEIERRIRDALIVDDRIEKVYDFQFKTPKKGVIFVEFKVDTNVGTIEAEKEVRV